METLQSSNGKFSKFKELNMSDFKKTMVKMKNTHSENDPFPIGDMKDAENFVQLQEEYFDIVSMSLSQAVFPKSEKLACI